MTSPSDEDLPTSVRRLQPADAPAWRHLRLRALREHPEAFTSGYEEEAPKPLSSYEQRIGAATGVRFWGAFAGGALVGMVGLDRELRAKARHKATVVAMYVAPEQTGRGFGRRLLDALLADARAGGVELLVLTVTRGNDAAAGLYRRLGFATFGVEPGAVKVDGRLYDKEHMFLRLPAEAAP